MTFSISSFSPLTFNTGTISAQPAFYCPGFNEVGFYTTCAIPSIPAFYCPGFNPLEFYTNCPPSISSVAFDTHDGFKREVIVDDTYSEKDYKDWQDAQKKLSKIEYDKRQASKDKVNKRKQAIKDIVEPKIPTVEITPTVLAIKEAPVEVLKKNTSTINREYYLDRISEKRHLLSLMKIVHELDDYDEINTEVNEYSEDSQLIELLDELNRHYKLMKEGL